eukprot:3884991-Rhodomonas_salina.1
MVHAFSHSLAPKPSQSNLASLVQSTFAIFWLKTDRFWTFENTWFQEIVALAILVSPLYVCPGRNGVRDRGWGMHAHSLSKTVDYCLFRDPLVLLLSHGKSM